MNHPTPFICDPRLWQHFLAACTARDKAPADLLRDLVRVEVERRHRRSTKMDDWVDPDHLAHLRHLVGEAIAAAGTWAELTTMLRQRGLAYAPSERGLLLVVPETGEVLCTAAQAGPGYGDLVLRFGQSGGYQDGGADRMQPCP